MDTKERLRLKQQREEKLKEHNEAMWNRYFERGVSGLNNLLHDALISKLPNRKANDNAR